MTKKRIGIHSKHVNGARPLGTPRPKPLIGFVHADELDDDEIEENDNAEMSKEKMLDTETAVPVDSLSDSATAISPTIFTGDPMQLTLKSTNKKGTTAIYGGARATVRIGLAAFTDKKADQTLEITGNFAGPKVAKAKMTPEERKAARAAAPKLTAAEKIAKMEARLAKAKAKLAEPVPA